MGICAVETHVVKLLQQADGRKNYGLRLQEQELFVARSVNLQLQMTP